MPQGRIQRTLQEHTLDIPSNRFSKKIEYAQAASCRTTTIHDLEAGPDDLIVFGERCFCQTAARSVVDQEPIAHVEATRVTGGIFFDSR